MTFSTFKETFDAPCSKSSGFYYAVKGSKSVMYDYRLCYYNLEKNGTVIDDDVTLEKAQAFLKTQEK